MTKNEEYTLGKGQSLQEMMMEKLGSHMQENETVPLSYSVHKNQLKMD